MSGWRPIETAPKDGTEFLAYDSAAKKQDVCVMQKTPRGNWYPNQVQIDGEYGPLEDDFGSYTADITHWMPLPTPPEDNNA